MVDVRLKFGKGDMPIEAVGVDPTGKMDPRHVAELVNVAAGRAAMARIGHRLFGHSLISHTKEGLMRCGQSWWEHSYKDAKDNDVEASHRYIDFAKAQGEPFATIATQPPDCLIYFMAARWADQGFPTLTMGERLAAALCGTEVPKEWYDDEIHAPWKAFVIEIPNALFTVFDPEHRVRTRATRVLVQRLVDGEGKTEWWWILFSERDQHFWRQGTVKQLLTDIEFGERETDRYERTGVEAFDEHVSQDERLYQIISRLVFNSILTLTDPERVKPVGSSHKRYENRKAESNERTGPPEQRVFIIGKPIDLDCRQAMRDYIEGRSREPFKIKAQFLVHGYWRWQPYGPKHSLRRRQWIEPYWKGPEDGVIPVREHKLGEGES